MIIENGLSITSINVCKSDSKKKKLFNLINSFLHSLSYNFVVVGEETIPLGTGKYTDIQKFDARVFACSSVLAKCTDIINRKVLEPSFEAILDAGNK